MSESLINQSTQSLRVWAEVDLSALRHNLACLQSQAVNQASSNAEVGSTSTAVMAVIKADAYGHGMAAVAECLESENMDFFGVAHVAEAQMLSDQGIKTRIYLLGATLPEEREQIVAHEWTPCICSLAEAEHFNELAKHATHLQGKQLKVHIAIDTGMGRGGFLPHQLSDIYPALLALDSLNYEGVASHFCASDEDREFTHLQITLYNDAVNFLKQQLNCDFKYKHLANTAGILDYAIPSCNLTRPGLGLYGIAVGLGEQESEETLNNAAQLKPVMTLKSKITLIRELPKGSSLSYGRDYITPRRMSVATVGIGYGDGYPRAVNQHGANQTREQQAQVWIAGQLCDVLGRVTMDQILVDVSAVPQAQIGSEVELFGTHLSVNQVAEWAGTIPWEIFTQITPRVRRIIKS